MSPIQLYYFPRACSLAVHIALEESGLPYQRHLVDLRNGENRQADYLARNPTGAVPAIHVDGWTLTETHAILTFIGDSAARALLPPTGSRQRYRAHEWMNFLSSSLHTYVRSIFRSSVYAGSDDTTCAAVNAQGVRNLAGAIAELERRLGDGPWALGATFSVVDCYLLVMYLWTTDERISRVPERPRWHALAQRIAAREAVKHVVSVERRDRDYPMPFPGYTH